MIWRHALPQYPGAADHGDRAFSYANLLEGSVLTEIIFSWPGIGSYITTALLSADMNAVLGGTVVVGLIFILPERACPIFSTAFFDPRAK